MAQINLLKQQSSNQDFGELSVSLLVKFLLLVLAGLAAYYLWLWISVARIDKAIAQAQQAAAQAEQKVAGVENRSEVYTRQAQLKEYDSLVQKHMYWSNFLPALAQVTLKGAVYSNLLATKEGSVTLAVTVPSLDSIDKFLQVFDLPETTKFFHNVRMGAFRANESEFGTSYSFDAQLQFDPSLLRYNDNKGSR